ncbi:hypothetical protein TUSST3_37390 [Streptomyces sp. TUS-ST3]|nr:hypothetical protein TUSST3_37390 [Streptomyces sp. TUS-ST3]
MLWFLYQLTIIRFPPWRVERMDGIEATRRIVATGGRTRVLIVTTFDLDEYAYEGLRAGASCASRCPGIPARSWTRWRTRRRPD